MVDVPTLKADPSVAETLVDTILRVLAEDRIIGAILHDRPTAQHLSEAKRLAEIWRPRISDIVDAYLDSFEEVKALNDLRIGIHNAFYDVVWNADLNRLNEIKVFLEADAPVLSEDPES